MTKSKKKFHILTFETKKKRIFAVVKIEEAIQHFADYITVERRLSPTTIHYYVREVKDFAHYLASLEINDIEKIEPYDVRDWLMVQMEKNSPGTVKKKLAALSTWMTYLRKNKYLSRDIMAAVSAPKTPERLPIFFRESEVEHIYDDIYPKTYEGELAKLVLRMLYETGMRRSELASLTLQDLDLGKLTIKVLGKGSKERIIPIENELAHNISQYLTLRDEKMAELQAQGKAASDSPRLLINSKGRPVSDSKIYSIVEQYMPALSQADRVSPHVFRHTFATHILSEGADINAVKELLGHSSLDATNIYTHVTREHLKETYKHAHPRATKK